MALTESTDHEERAAARLTGQFRRSVSVVALLKSYVEQVQALEAAAFDVRDGVDLDAATGAQLDAIGKIVGESRQGRDDDTYRAYLRVRVHLNVSSGTRDQIIRLFQLLGFESAVLVDQYPAAFVVQLYGVSDGLEETYAELLQEAAAAGVRVIFEYTTCPEAEAFTLDVGPGLDQGKLGGAL